MTSETQNPPEKWPPDRKEHDSKRFGIDDFSEIAQDGGEK